MKCPLLDPTEIVTGEGKSYRGGDCLQEECAWWNRQLEECCLMSIGRVLSNIADHIAEIENKMPHEGQFRK